MKENISKVKLYLTLFALGLAGGAIFIIPYIRSVFYDLQLEVSGMTNAQSALLLTGFSIASLIFDVPCGMLCDKIESKKGLIFALVGTTLVTIVYAFFNTSFVVAVIIWLVLAFLTMGIYWPIFSKVLNIIGNKTGTAGRSGTSFGIYYAFNGICAAILQAVMLWVSGQFSDPAASFRAAILIAAGSTILATIIIVFCFDSELATPDEKMATEMKKEKEHSKVEVKQLTDVLKNPMVWMTMLICMIAYTMYTMMSYFTPFLTAVVGISPDASGVFAIIRTYVFLILALVGGIIADKIFKSTTKWMLVVFALTAVIIGGLFIMPAGVGPLFVSCYTLLPAALVQMSYPLKYSVIGEIGIPQGLLGTATGLAAFAGALPDLFLGPIIGTLIDNRGNEAYYILFAILIVLLIIGCICAAFIVKNQNKGKKTALQ